VSAGNEGLVDGITLSEHRRMLEAAASDRDRIFLRLLWLTAGRIREIIGLQANRISTDLGEISPRNLKRPKDAAGHETVEYKPLSLKPAEMAEITEYCARNKIAGAAFLFPGRKSGTHLTTRRGRTIFYEAATAAGVERQSLRTRKFGPAWPHCSRHGAARHLLRAGVDVAIVQKRLGHSQISNTLKYLALDTGDQRRELATVEM